MRDMLAMQKQLEEEQAKEMMLAANAQTEKKRLLNDLAEQVRGTAEAGGPQHTA